MFFASMAQRARGAASVLGLAVLSTCANLDNIDVETSGKATIPKATLVDKLLGDALAFVGMDQIDFTQEFKNQGVSKDDVDSVRLSSMTLSIEAPPTGNFDFLQRIEFFAESDGLPKVSIASIETVPAGSKTLNLVVTNAELKPYVVAPSMRITSQVKGSRPDEDTTVKAEAVLDVDVTVPGCE